MSASGPILFVVALVLGAALGAALVADRARDSAPPAGASFGGSPASGDASSTADASPTKASAPAKPTGRATTIRKDDTIGPTTALCVASSCTNVVGQQTRRVNLGVSGASWAAHDLNLTWTSSALTTRLSATLRACPPRDACTDPQTVLASIQGTSPLRFRDESVSIGRTSVVYLDVTLTTTTQPAAAATASPQPQPFHIEGVVKAPPRSTT